MLSKTLKKWGSLKNLFYQYYKPEQDDIGKALNNFVDFFLKIDTSAIYGRNIKPNGLTQFFPSPEKGSACKRLNLFLRWMIRKDSVDPGGWDELPASKLIIPLDTHMYKIGKKLGFTKRKQANMKTALEITKGFAKLASKDPVKYDFALTRFGIRNDMHMKDLTF